MRLNYTETGKGSPVVLLHGMAASRRYWDNLMPLLAPKHRAIAVDLLGFGLSPKPRAAMYTPTEHIGSIMETLRNIGLEGSFTLVGHSMGALLALQLAATHPKRVDKLVLLNPPVYKNATQAKGSVTKTKKRLRLLYYGPSSRLACTLWCRLLRPLSKHVAPLYLKHLPRAVAQDTVLHSWQSYTRSLHNVIQDQQVQKDLSRLTMPVEILYGDRDSRIILSNARALKLSTNIRLAIEAGTHNLPLENPSLIAKTIG